LLILQICKYKHIFLIAKRESCASSLWGINHTKGDKMNVQVKLGADKITIQSPFSESNNSKFRSCGGKFEHGQWVFSNTPVVQKMIDELWGTSEKIVTIEISKDKLMELEEFSGIVTMGSSYEVGGYVLAQRRSRDYAAQLAETVQIWSGTIPSSGGSFKNPAVKASDDAVFRLNVREDFAIRHNLNIVAEHKISLDNLMLKREKLLAELEKVNTEIEELK